MSLSQEEITALIKQIEAVSDRHHQKREQKEHPINIGIDDAVKQVVKELTLEILKTDDKAKAAMQRHIKDSIASCIYSEKDHREASKEN